MFSSSPAENDPRSALLSKKLDQFSKTHQQPLAALAWAFRQQFLADADNSPVPHLGIDLEPTPHFISCEPAIIAQFNEKIDRRLNELVGILEGSDPETEVAIFVVTPAQFKLIFFQPEMSPSDCFQALNLSLETLQHQLEMALQQDFTDSV